MCSGGMAAPRAKLERFGTFCNVLIAKKEFCKETKGYRYLVKFDILTRILGVYIETKQLLHMNNLVHKMTIGE